ncbi:hypothetical protein PVAP13_6KG175812 [Panicum virgatum]|uniref:Uncharacterized protein n=1 Tax=Panicum virgatum TaxID=38727 RepID=A0A8T0RDG2_PANVG|nr:hypothetical protein PVAP13_6KG175812 [Panicum virgatum]
MYSVFHLLFRRHPRAGSSPPPRPGQHPARTGRGAPRRSRFALRRCPASPSSSWRRRHPRRLALLLATPSSNILLEPGGERLAVPDSLSDARLPQQVDGLAPWLLAPRPGRACCRSSSSPAAAGKVLAAPDPPAWRLTRPATSSCNKSRVKNSTRREGQQALTN